MTEPNQRWRERTVEALRRYYERERFPRLIVMVLLLATGGVGFLASAGMLWLGVHEMWIRYPVAVLLAYIAFVALIRLWAEGERSRTDANRELEKIAAAAADHQPPPDRSGWEWLDALNYGPPDFDEGCLPVLVVGALLALVVALSAVVCAAPGLLAEVFLDVVLVAALYKRLSRIERRHWLATAIRRTWMPAFSAAVVLALAGALMQALVPEARSIGQVWERVVGK
ncbi:MAG: hypothetical protein WCV00_13690 [Verrucomicrobiia bacterium]